MKYILILLILLTFYNKINNINNNIYVNGERPLNNEENGEAQAKIRPDKRKRVSYWDSYARKAMEAAPIAQQLAEMKRKSIKEYFEPLPDVILTKQAPTKDPNIVGYTNRLEIGQVPKKPGNTEWLDTSLDEDRQLVGEIFQYCTDLFAMRGTIRDCVIQCHPKVNCGSQAARICGPAKKLYKEWVKCADRERKFCKKYGQFDDEKYPNFRPDPSLNSDYERVQDVIIYCGNMFQYRGVRLPCLRSCSIYTMRQKYPDSYFYWKAKHRLFVPYGASTRKDPAEPWDGATAIYSSCEKAGLQSCRFLQQAFWRECYERVKMNCLRTTAPYNRLLGSELGGS